MLLLEKYFQNCQACFGHSECLWVKCNFTCREAKHYSGGRDCKVHISKYVLSIQEPDSVSE